MEKFKEFQGKDLDEAIERACGYFDCVREKMEIEILQDAKTGIFGIVGARKAKIRARRAELRDAVESALGIKQGSEKNARKQPASKKESRREASRPQPEIPAQPKAATAMLAAGGADANLVKSPASEELKKEKAEKNKKNAPGPGEKREARHVASVEAPATENHGEDQGEMEDGFAPKPLEELDADKLEAVVKEVVGHLIAPIAGKETPVHVELGNGRIRARVEWEGDAGLLIGREGLTLVALQYLASRMVSRAMRAALKVHLDIGDYHRRQDDKLRESAHMLAEKARRTGRSWSTRPLSSYHRRIIHLSLQNEKDVQTRSSGDGPLKRVIISPRRKVEHEG